jgi:hypothetical protein
LDPDLLDARDLAVLAEQGWLVARGRFRPASAGVAD